MVVLAVILIAAGLALAFVLTQRIRFTPDTSMTVPPGVSASVPTQPASRSARALPWSIPERVVIGPSPYPGNLGADANAYYNNMLSRDANAQQGAPLSPISSSGFGFGGTP